MTDPNSEDGFYLTLEETPDDRATLLALADWHDEQGNDDAAGCLRWLVAKGRFPFRYRRGTLKVSTPEWRDSWFWWAVEVPRGETWGHSRECRLPQRLWEQLRHNLGFTPAVFKEYATARAAFEALLDAWPRAQPLERTERRR